MALVELLLGVDEPVVLPLHPRTRLRLESAGLLERLARWQVHVTPPLGYVELTALLCNARAVLTDSGGLQKEAYLAGVPCVTLRPSTEWVETVEAGWNTLVDLDLGGCARCLRDAASSSAARSCTATVTPASVSWPHSCAAVRQLDWPANGSIDRSRSASPVSATGDRTWRATSRACRAASCAGCATALRPRAHKAATQFPGARVTADLEDLLDDPELDAVVLATPVPTHADLAVQVLEAGKHCFVEKPLAQSVADAERAVAAAARGGQDPDGRAPARVPPRRADAEGAGGQRRAG